MRRQGVHVLLEAQRGSAWVEIGKDETNSDGRCPKLLPVDHKLVRASSVPQTPVDSADISLVLLGAIRLIKKIPPALPSNSLRPGE